MNNVVVDTREIEMFAKKLGTLPKQALPSAVRNTLNSLAFDVKQRSLPISARKNFENRSKNFFKANSAVKQATGFNLQTMHSVVGMFENKLQDKSNNYAVQDLEQQEHGGRIGHKTFIPMKPARVGQKGVTRRQNLMDKTIDSAINVKRISTFKGKNGRRQRTVSEEQKFAVAVHAAGVGGFVRHRHKGKHIVWRVNSLNKNKDGRFKITPMFTVDKGRSINVKATHFMEEAAKHTTKKTNAIFKKASEFQFQKHLKV